MEVDTFEKRKYKHGQPFLVGDFWDECSSSARKLHKYCMDGISEGEDTNIVELHYDQWNFSHVPGTISVEFEDFHLFFNFDELTTTLVKCLML